MKKHGLSVAVINVDGWLNLPNVRFNPANPAAHFYEHAIRFEEMFAQLVDPLVRDRGVDLEFDFTEETATALPQAEAARLPTSMWSCWREFSCSSRPIERASISPLDRYVVRDRAAAGDRARPGRSAAAETIRAFETIYFPAQRLHLARDNPAGAARFRHRQRNPVAAP